MTSTATGRNGFRHLAAVMCLVAFGLGPTKLLPFVFALAAGAEGSHFVQVREDSNGATAVVLRHAPDSTRTQGCHSRHSSSDAQHRHGWASRAVCLLSGAQTGEADHVACFDGGGIAEAESKASGLRAASQARTVDVALQLDSNFLFAFQFPSSPDDSGCEASKQSGAATVRQVTARLECLRPTRLLI